jgi:cell division protein FtsL
MQMWMRVSDKRTTDCQRQVWMSADAHNLFMTSKGRIFLIAVSAIIVTAVAIFGRLYGQELAYGAMQDRDSAIRQLELESQRLQLEKSSQNANMQNMHTEAERLQAQLDAIIPSQNRYTIEPNQSLLLSDGHLTVGLIGAPRDDGIDININGKRYAAVVGDTIHIAPDPSTACDVKIESFNMFKAQLTASCAADKTG